MDGIILINKQKNYTSHDIVAILKKKLNITKVGHTGTLDPNATGVLPILLGNATKLSKYLINHDKSYTVTLKLGEKTDTKDREGKIIEQKEVKKLDKDIICNVLKTFVGEQLQTPPMYSAIKIKGKKLYQYARNNEKVEVPARKINIYKIELINFSENEIMFNVDCSKGTYIRSLCEDIAEKLDTVGYMKELERTKVGEFEIKDSHTIEENLEKYIISMEQILKKYDSIILSTKNIKQYLNGVLINIEKPDGVYKMYCEKFIGTGTVKSRKLKRDIVI